MRWLVLILVLAGCATQQSTAQIYGKYVGQTVVALVTKVGPPAATFDVGDGTRSFQWKHSAISHSGGSATVIGGSVYTSPTVSQEVNCIVTFQAKKTGLGDGYADYTVVGFSPPGPNC